MPATNLTKYVPSKGLFFGGSQVMTPNTVSRWAGQFNTNPKVLGGLRLLNPQQIINGGNIGYRPENQSYATIGRSTIFQGGAHGDQFQHLGKNVTLTEHHHDPILHRQIPTLTQSTSSTFSPRVLPQPQVQTRSTPTISVISTPHISSSRPLIRSPYLHTDPYGIANYLDLRYEDLSREIERARFQRKLERLEDDYTKTTRRRKKTPQKRRKTPKRKTTRRKKSKAKKKK